MRHDGNTLATMLLMSQMIAGKEELVLPLNAREYYALRERAKNAGLSMGDLLSMDMSAFQMRLGMEEGDAFRACVLLGRTLPLSMAMEKFYANGIDVMTIDGAAYPARLSERLGQKAPPMLYFAGNAEILWDDAIGIVGGKPLKGDCEERVRALVRDVSQAGCAIVSEGSTDVARAVLDEAQRCGARVILCAATALSKCASVSVAAGAIREGRALALSMMHPDTVYTASHARKRNKLIYGLSQAVFVFSADDGRGATFEGAAESLRNGFCKHVYAWDTKLYPGNARLISMGAKRYGAGEAEFSDIRHHWAASYARQMSLFGNAE
ncbi:MAG: DNA-processing protein DprA [Christensenellales bacterium]|jgi:DNA processing protein